MNDLERRQLISQTFRYYGEAAQLNQLQEECAELILAINKYRRKKENALNNFIEEIVDVEILIDQFKNTWFQEDEINKYRDYQTIKFARLRDRLKGDSNE